MQKQNNDAEHRSGQSSPPAREDDIDRLIRRLEVVNEASLIITAELSLEAVLQKIVDLAREIAGARFAALGVPDNQGGLAQFLTSGMTPEQIAAIPHLPKGLGLLGELLRDPRPLRVSNIADDPRAVGFPPHHPRMTSFLGVPIISKGIILGNFYLADKLGAKEFSLEDERMIEMLASHAAVAIENARLYGQTDEKLREQLDRLARSERRAQFMSEVSRLLSTSLDVQPLLHQVVKRSTTVLGDAAAVILWEPGAESRTKLTLVHHDDPARVTAAEQLLRQAAPLLVDRAIDRGDYILVAPAVVLPDNETEAALRPRLTEEKFSACIAVPIKASRGSYGAFISLATQPNPLDEADLTLALGLAERIGLALENADLYADLKKALKLREEFISIASHELKTPITSLKIASQLAQRTIAKRVSECGLESVAQHLGTLVRQIDRLAKLTDELLDVSRLQAGRLELHRERIDLVHLSAEVVDRFRAEVASEGRHQLHLSAAHPEIWGDWDIDRIEQVLVNLISNAIKYSPDGGDVTVTIDQAADEVEVTVADQGVGIPQDQLGRIFEAFHRATNVENRQVPGIGLGLHITKQIVELHGGQIWAESVEGKGTTVRFSLPLASAGFADAQRA